MKRNNRDFPLFICFVLLGTWITWPCTILAQAPVDIEGFVGFSHIQTDPGVDGVESFGANGFHIEVTRFLSPKFGIAAEFGGNYGSTTTDIEGVDEISIDQYGFLVGPRLNSLGFWRINLSTRALIGFSTAHVEADLSSEDFPIIASVEGTETDLAIAFGASVDLKLSERISLRLIQSNFFYTFFRDDTQANSRYSTGLVARF